MMYRGTIPAAAAACALLILPFLAAPSGADDPATIVAKHKAYVGWSYGDGTLKSVRSTTVAEAPAPATPAPNATPDPLGEANFRMVEFRRELLYRTTAERYGASSGESGFTGSVFWNANENGQTVTVRAKAARIALTGDLIDAEAIAEAPASARPNATFDGKIAAVVRIDPKTGVPADLYFDPQSGALLGVKLQPDDANEVQTLHVLSYGEFTPGKRYVSAYRYGESKRIYRVTKFEANAPVSDADLHPPGPRPTWTFGAPRTIPITIAEHGNGYTNTGNRAVHVSVAINGKTGTFLLDSGASGTLIFDPFAKEAKVKDVARTAYFGVNGSGVRAAIATVDSLQIGGSTLHNVYVTHGARGGAGLDGIIGFDVLAGSVIEVDLRKAQLSVLDPAKFEPEEQKGAWAFTPDLTTFHIGVPVSIGNTVLSQVWLDTGNDFELMLSRSLEKKFVALTNEIKLSNGQSFEDIHYFGGVDGSSVEPARCKRLNEVRVGPYRYTAAPVCFAPNDALGSDGGILGFDFLKHFNWTFDYPHNRVVLAPNGL